MKTLVIAIALGLAGGLASAAHAESFNDRGEDFIASVKPDPRTQRQPVGILLSGFNDRSEAYAVRVAATPNKPLNDIRITHSGFNDHSHINVY
ncbi:MAG: hypothetical protein IPP10_03050 [Candidatus Competibacteraceae bacterium]|nr:hypothetical protein [Candidatus Competibacteraceae bacterium]MBK8963630.1 hypothetical protein [Candidatus Competibacteraceae bacterium]MBK9950521.1 hypothetical protein [Candidatus Competibacteraceae bacterium]